MVHARRKLCRSLIDQECLQSKIELWKEEDPSTNIYFRPKGIVGVTSNSEHDKDKENIEDNLDEAKLQPGSETSLLFVYQSEWQKRLLNRYGQELILLDATYRTTRYALPLFFLVVKTNIDYQIVATFVTENETQESIEEALNVIKYWNEGFTPKFAMTDYCIEEIHALESVFEGMC